MTKQEIFEGVSQAMQESLQLPPEKITLESRLVEDLDIDSLFVVQMIMELEDHFKVRVEDQDIATFKVVSDIVDYVDSKLGDE